METNVFYEFMMLYQKFLDKDKTFDKNEVFREVPSETFEYYYSLYLAKYPNSSREKVAQSEMANLQPLISGLEKSPDHQVLYDEIWNIAIDYKEYLEQIISGTIKEPDSKEWQAGEQEPGKVEIKHGDLTLLALKHCYLHLGYRNSNYEITWENKEEIAISNKFTNKNSGKKLFDYFKRCLKYPNERKNGAQSVRKLEKVKKLLIGFPESIAIIDRDLKESRINEKQNKFSA